MSISILIFQEVKDTIDKQALLRCMRNCYEISLSEHINLPDIVKIDNGDTSLKGSVKNLASMGGGVIHGILVRILNETEHLYYTC